MRELFIVDMLQAGRYLVRRGMKALSLPVRQLDIHGFVDDAVEKFVHTRQRVLEPVDARCE